MKYIFIWLFILSSHIICAQEVVVRTAGQDGVHTHRIPALVTTGQGTLLAAYDCRYDSSRDLQGNIDIGLSRSTDRGATWEPLKITLDMGEWGGLPQKFNGVSDPCLLVDTVTGRIWVAALWMHGVLDAKGEFTEGLTEQSSDWQHQWVGLGSQSGLTPGRTSQFLMAYSDDDGVTWSAPINITSAVKPAAWWLYAPAPGAGITMRDGTLVLPTQGRNENGEPFSNITYSVDHGKTWITTAPATFNTSECAVVELSDGSLMLNIRDNRNREQKGDNNGRAIYTTMDLGRTWVEHPTSRSALKEPVCMASIHRHGSLLLFSNPASVDGRINMTLKKSTDNGATWNEVLVLDADPNFGYSCITSLDSETVGVIWEGSRAQLVFRALKISELQ